MYEHRKPAHIPVKSAQRVLDIFEYFVSVRAPTSLSALAAALKLPKSSCLALIETLQARGYLYEVRPRVGYYPTRRWLDKAQIVSNSDPLIARVRPVMIDLREAVRETLIFGKRSGDHVIYIEVVESPQTLRYVAVAGQFKPLHGTASGKALLAGMTPPDRHSLLSRYRFERLTPRTIAELAAFERDIQRGIERGWHISRGENEPDTTAVAVPVMMAGEIFFLAAAGMTARVGKKTERIGAKLRAAARRLDQR
jgi:IclR family acetate operon transcriptional repressor